jgi:hypothetical protein
MRAENRETLNKIGSSEFYSVGKFILSPSFVKTSASIRVHLRPKKDEKNYQIKNSRSHKTVARN